MRHLATSAARSRGPEVKGVGAHMREHIGLSAHATTNLPCPDGAHKGEEWLHAELLGALEDQQASFVGFFNTTGNTPHAKGPQDLELFVLEGCADGRFALTFTAVLLHPKSEGRVLTVSRDRPSTGL